MLSIPVNLADKGAVLRGCGKFKTVPVPTPTRDQIVTVSPIPESHLTGRELEGAGHHGSKSLKPCVTNRGAVRVAKSGNSKPTPKPKNAATQSPDDSAHAPEEDTDRELSHTEEIELEDSDNNLEEVAEVAEEDPEHELGK